MIQGEYTNVINLFSGMNIADTPDVISKKGQATFILNCFNYPTNGIAKLFGRSQYNPSNLSGSKPVTGIYQLNITTPAFYAFSDTKVFKDNGSGTFTDITGSVTLTSDPNNLFSFASFENSMIAANYKRDAPILHDGGSGNVSAVPNMPAGRYLAVLANQLWVFNTSSNPNLGYWSGIDDYTSWDTGNDFMSFKATENDYSEITGVGNHLNTIIVGKLNSLFRMYATGTVPAFQYYAISQSIGIASHYSVQNIAPVGQFPERLIWMGKDNFYQLIGDNITSIADDIQPFFNEGAPFQINLSRSQYCSSGLLKQYNLYWCTFSSGSNTTNDYIFILDYKNMMWMLCDFPSNYMAVRNESGRDYIYSGTYDGIVARHDPAIYNNLGVAYTSQLYFPWIDFGDTQTQKKLRYLIALFQAVGNYSLTFEYRTDLQTNNFTIDLKTGADLLGVDFILGTSTLGGVSLIEQNGELMTRCKRFQLLITHSTLNEYFRLYSIGIMWEKLRGRRIS